MLKAKYRMMTLLFFCFHMHAVNAADGRFTGWWTHTCDSLLRWLHGTRMEIAAEDLRRMYNRSALNKIEARIFGPSAVEPLVRVLAYQPEDGWDLALTRARVEETLDRTLPFWRNDGDWYFQNSAPVRLYTRHSLDPKLFARDSLLLMEDDLVIGHVKLLPVAAVDLFD